MQNRGPPSTDKINIGYNKSNEQYIQLLEEQNRIRRESQNARERQESKRKEEKEKGFNLHINGANEERIREQRKQEVLRGTSQNDSNSQQRQRRMWRNPASIERQSENSSTTGAAAHYPPKPEAGSHHPKYHNPFDLRAKPTTPSSDFAPKDNNISQTRQRKKWGEQAQSQVPAQEPQSSSHHQHSQHSSLPPRSGTNVHVMHGKDKSNSKRKEEDDYSDSFEEIHQEIEEAPDTDSLERHDVEEDKQDETIEQFLRTATHQDIISLKDSLSNFGNFGKIANNAGPFKGAINLKKDNSKQQHIEEDDYIEEEFDEVIDSDHEAGNSSEEEKATIKAAEQQKQAQVMVSKNIATTARNARNRPISATFNLEASKVGASQKTQRTNIASNPYYDQSTSNMGQQFQSSQISAQMMQPSYSMLQLKPDEPKLKQPPVSVMMDTPKQPNDFMKKPINTNPFRRPYSQYAPQRSDPQQQQRPIEYPSQNQLSTQPYSSSQSTQQQQQYKDVPAVSSYIPDTVQEEIEENKESTVKKQVPIIEQSTVSALSTSKVPIGAILQKIEKLDDWQKEKLLEILDSFDANAALGLLGSAKKTTEALDLKFLSPPQQQNVASKPGVSGANRNLASNFGIPKDKQELVIRIMKTYGNPHLCGLTEIEVFDHQSKKIQLVPASIIARNLGPGPKLTLTKLLNEHKLTNEERHMWIAYLPLPPKHLEIVITLPKDQQIGGLKIWNYNKSAIDFTKGVKDVQILSATFNEVSGKDEQTVIWQGTLERGKGQTNVEYATFIKIREDVQLPREIQPIAHKKIEQPIIPEIINEEQEEAKEILKQPEVKEEIMRNYRSEATIKQDIKATNDTPIWLAGASQPSHQASAAMIKKDQQEKPLMSRRLAQQQENTSAAAGTYDLLGKFATNQQISSQVASTRANQPNIALNNRQQLQETSDAIKQAVNRVNQITQQQQQPQQQSKSVPASLSRPSEEQWGSSKQQARQQSTNIEESLENLDLFKATNLGRLLAQEEQKSQKQGFYNPSNNRQQWKQKQEKQLDPWQGIMSPGTQKARESQLSSAGGTSRKGGAHVLVKNPFPTNEISLNKAFEKTGQSNSVLSQKEQVKKPLVNLDDDLDILDQFLGNNQKPLQQQQANKPIKTERLPQPQQKPLFSYEQTTEPQIQTKTATSVQSQYPVSQNNTQQTMVQASSETFEEKLSLFSQDFMMPTLPSGQRLYFNLLTTWGDMNYVGLTGIEVFDSNGKQVKIQDISACPPDINILPGYGGDPRTVDKLIDGSCFTNDDLHVWLTPFTAGEDHTITMDLPEFTSIAMIRIWNYNKSRIHSYRGARLVAIELDGKKIFRGEIKKAPGNLNDPEQCCEILLFTDDEDIMKEIDLNDWVNEETVVESALGDTQRLPFTECPEQERPLTATKKFNTSEIEDIQKQLMRQQKPTSLFDERPQTSAIIEGGGFDQKMPPPPLSNKKQLELAAPSKTQNENGCRGRIMEIHILETWGDLFYVGLTGVEILDQDGKSIPLTISMLDASPRDMNSIQGGTGDYRTLDKLVDGVNNTTDDRHMWLIPFNQGETHKITIDLAKSQTISGIKFYNYNKSEEDTLRGAKQVVIWIDKRLVTPKKGVTLRKATGGVHSMLDMGHLISFPFKQGWNNDKIIPLQRPTKPLSLYQEYELLSLPMGFTFKINLYSTHSDFFYIGMDALQLFDQCGNSINVPMIVASPEGVHKLKGMEGDARVVTNLINKRQGAKPSNVDDCWLAPFKNTKSYSAVTGSSNKQQQNDDKDYRVPNYVMVVFSQVQTFSALRLWNYTKTPSRGVHEFEVVVDDKQVYRGFARKGESTSVLFTTEEKIVETFREEVYYDPSKQQSVMLINEKKVMNMNQTPKRPSEEVPAMFNEMERPQTMASRKKAY